MCPRGERTRAARNGTTDSEIDGVEQHLVRGLGVELHERESCGTAHRALLGEERVAALDDCTSDRLHRAGSIEQEPDVRAVLGIVHEASDDARGEGAKLCGELELSDPPVRQRARSGGCAHERARDRCKRVGVAGHRSGRGDRAHRVTGECAGHRERGGNRRLGLLIDRNRGQQRVALDAALRDGHPHARASRSRPPGSLRTRPPSATHG